MTRVSFIASAIVLIVSAVSFIVSAISFIGFALKMLRWQINGLSALKASAHVAFS